MRLLAGVVSAAQVLVLLALRGGLSVPGWCAGLAVGAVAGVLLSRGLWRSGIRSPAAMPPAHWVTLARTVLIGGVTALVVSAWSRPLAVMPLTVLAAVALCLDAIDGQVARRTGTTTTLGARFDMEVDAFLIAVLSVQAAREHGLWILAIGAARYGYVLAGWVWPWLREVPPPRHWRKVVAAIQGIAATVVVSGILPRPADVVLLAMALLLLADSFGWDIWWLWQRHRGHAPSTPPPARTVARWTGNVLAIAMLWLALVVPYKTADLMASTLLSLPLELVVLAGLLLVLPRRIRWGVAASLGAFLGLLTVLKMVALGFSSALGRPFHPLLDRGTFRSAFGVLSESIGHGAAVLAAIGLGLAAAGTVAGLAWCTLQLARVVGAHRRAATRAVVGSAAAWLLLLAAAAIAPIGVAASAGTSTFAYQQARQIPQTLADQRRFERVLAARDPWSTVPADRLLTALRGKDVLVIVVESYGEVAVHHSPIAPGIDRALRRDAASLDAAGYHPRSGMLVSPTFGGISWLAHATFQSGLWVDSQQRYDQLMAGGHFTLSRAFAKAGWRTVADVPSNTENWPDGRSFYHYGKVYDSRNVGYAGPRFGYARIPDQFTLHAFAQRELTHTHRKPVMAEIDLVSSHTPWAPLPHMLPWTRLGDGTVYDRMARTGDDPDVVWRHPADVRAHYAASIRYSMRAITSFIEHLHDDNLVTILYGDHQPSTTVSGSQANHQVPISIITRDRAILERIDGWRWTDGLVPASDAPVWPMDRFRNRLLAAFSPGARPSG